MGGACCGELNAEEAWNTDGERHPAITHRDDWTTVAGIGGEVASPVKNAGIGIDIGRPVNHRRNKNRFEIGLRPEPTAAKC